MTAGSFRILIYVSTAAILLTAAGCDESKKDKTGAGLSQLEKSAAAIEPGTTIGDVADVFSPDYIPVQTYAIVGELAGTGSADCPPNIRDYLKQYILRYMPSADIDEFINSPDTSVVIAEGLMPTTGRGASFDVRAAVPGAAQTTSLEHGQLYGAELRAAGSFGLATKVLAQVEGPVYIDKIEPTGELRVGYILGGGYAIDDYKMVISLRQSDYFVASTIRNKLIERFGQGTAKALSPGQVEMMLPAQYAGRKQRFISIVKATHLSLGSDARRRKIDELISCIAGSGDKDQAEICLEAIGKDALGPLEGLVGSADGDVRFRAARIMLNLGSDAGLDVLRSAAFDPSSRRRMEAIEAVGGSAKRSDAIAVCRRLLRDDDVTIILAAYEQLRKMDDISINDQLIGRSFYLENITLAKKKLIFVSRSGQPRIALFGGPLFCRSNLFIQSEDGNITLNAPPGEERVTVMRKIVGKPEIPPVSLKCSYELGDIIQTLGAEPARRKPTDRVGLAVAYCDIVALLNQMVQKGAIDCQFQAGPMPQIGLK
jgi:hypothetical protein